MNVDDYFAIQNLLFSYPATLDKGDFDGVGELFKHARVISSGRVMADRNAKDMADSFKNWVITYPDGTPRTRHFICNVQITPLSEHRAQISSYVMVFQQTDTLPLQPVIGGDYKDTVEKVDGQWRFIERIMGNDLIGNLKDHGRDFSTITPSRAN
jgi:3-phenylpropionate/cinnamic acid dioxygenase small subunit